MKKISPEAMNKIKEFRARHITETFGDPTKELIESRDVCEILRTASSICGIVKHRDDSADKIATKLYNVAIEILSTRETTEQESLCLSAFRIEAFKATHSDTY
jgi:hypothetical protein